MTTDDTTAFAVQFLRDMSEDYAARADKADQRAEVQRESARVHRSTRAELLEEADRLEELGKTMAPEFELLARLGMAMELEGVLALVWCREGVWVLCEDGEEVRTFASGVTASTFETSVPALAAAGDNKRAALLAILAVVEVTS